MFFKCKDIYFVSVKWDIEHIVFGEDVILTCNGTVCGNSVRRWIGGPFYDILCYKNFSKNSSKYEMISKDSGQSFGLRIKNFTFDDANCKYTCACGLHQYTDSLDVGAFNYTCNYLIHDIYRYSHYNLLKS